MGSSTTGRRAGLSKNDRPPPLLKNLPTRDATKVAATSKKRSRTPEEVVDIFAAPASSGDESSEEDEPNPPAKAGRGGKSPSSSGDESPDRADIRPTFPSSLNSTTSISSHRSKFKYGSSQRSVKTYGSARSSQESKPSSSQRSRNAKESRDELGSVEGESLLRDPGRKFTKGQGIKPSSPRAPRQKRSKKTAKEPERQSTPPLPGLILPDDMLSPDGNGKRSFALDISEANAKTPSPEKPTRSLRIMSRSPSAPAVEANLDMRLLDHSDDSGTESKRRNTSRVSLIHSPARSRGKTTDRLNKGLPQRKSKPAPTPTQLDFSFDVDDSSLSELSSPGDFSEQATKAQCPYCKSPVHRDDLQEFSKGAYMTLRMQRRFCTQHKKDDARAEWRLKGYPDIDWAHLDERISSHQNYLEQVLRGKQCHYGDLLAEDVKAGLKRDLAKADFNSTPGYYGERGFRVMQEGIFARFSKLLRKRAVEDGLVSARGYSLYVQAVLVPELAVRLVMEDMGVAEVPARGILEESTWVGELLCEDEGDIVDENDENLF